VQHTESNWGYLLTAARYFGTFGPPDLPRKLVLGGHVTMAPRNAGSSMDPDVIDHWLADYAARAEFDAVRLAQL
jgi:hypothetical protein